MLKRVLLAAAVISSAFVFMPGEAAACGFKRLNAVRSPAYNQSYTASVRGKVFIYKDSVDRRVEMALRQAGYQVTRGDRMEASSGASVILATAEHLRDAKPTTATVVTVQRPGTRGAVAGSKYVVQQGQSVSSQLAVVVNAFRGRGNRI